MSTTIKEVKQRPLTELEKMADPAVLAFVNAAIADLEEKAVVLITGYEAWRKKMNDGKRPLEQSILTPRLRSRRGLTSFMVMWKWTRFVRTANGTEAWSQELNKGRGTFIYSRTTLQKKAKSWEIDEAYRVEKELAKLRREADYIRRMWLAHGNHLQYRKKLEAEANAE